MQSTIRFHVPYSQPNNNHQASRTSDNAFQNSPFSRKLTESIELEKIEIVTLKGKIPIANAGFLPTYIRENCRVKDTLKPKECVNEKQAALERLNKKYEDLILAPTDETKNKFLEEIKAQTEVKHALRYLFKPQIENDRKKVNIGRDEPFELITYRPAPIHLMADQKDRMGLTNLLEKLVNHFNKKGIAISYPQMNNNKNTHQPNSALDINRLSNTYGIHKDRQSNTFIGHFDKDGLLEGTGMIINDKKKSTLTGKFKAGSLTGQGIYIDDQIRLGAALF